MESASKRIADAVAKTAINVTFITTALLVVLLPALGKLEGKFFPVTTPANFTSVKTQFDKYGWVTVYGNTSKLRDCDFRGMEVRLDRVVAVQWNFLEPAAVRSADPFSFGPWEFQLTPEQLATRTTITVEHACHPFWLTSTTFYKPTN